MLRAFILHRDADVSTDASHDAIAAALHDPGAVMWIDLFKPDDNDIALLRDVFHFHPLTIEDSYTYTQRPKIDHYEVDPGNCPVGYFYLVFHGPDLETFKESLRTKEVDVFVSPRFMVTVHDERMRSIDGLTEFVTKDPKTALHQGIDQLLYRLLDRVVDAYEPILDHFDEVLESLEERAVNDPRPELLHEIAKRKRELLNLRRVVSPQREVVAQLARGDVQFIPEATRVYFRDVLDHINRVVELVELYRDIALGSRDIYLSSVSNNLNQVMKTLTIFSVIALPMTVVTGFFGMNFDTLPGIHSPRVFWIAVAFTAAVVAVMLSWFRWRRWI